MLSLLIATLLATTPTIVDSSLFVIPNPVEQFIEAPAAPEPPKDFYRYRVVYRWHGQRCIRWRTDYILSTVTLRGDTLARDITNSELQQFIATHTEFKDDDPVCMTQRVARYEQRRSGLVTRLYSVDENYFDETRLRARDAQWSSRDTVTSVPPRPSRK